MSIMALAVVAIVVLVLLTVGIAVGWMIGTSDRQRDILSRRLAADALITKATRDTLHAVREAVRHRTL